MAKKSTQELGAILFTDIEGYTYISNSDQELGVHMAQSHQLVIENCAQAFSGEIINFWGDGSLSVYHSAKDAIFSAIEMQKKFQSEYKVPVRIGIHIGEVVRDENSAYGDAVNIASRIQSLSPKGGILVSDAVKKAIGKIKGFELKEIGKEYLKNIPTPIGLFYVSHPEVSIASKAEIHGKAQKQTNNLPTGNILSNLIQLVMLVFILGLVYYFITSSSQQKIPQSAYAEKLAVLPFKNLSGIPKDSMIGKLAANIIIRGLNELEGTHLISYNYLDRYQPAAEARFFSNSQVPRITKAINVLEGEYYKEGDSIIFKTTLKNLKTGEYIHVFADQKSIYHEPGRAIGQLSNFVKGYWAGREYNVMNFPNYDALEYYLRAVRLWNGNEQDSICEVLLNKSIQADSNFLDPYLLKLDLYRNLYSYDIANSWLEIIEDNFPEEKLNTRQRNMRAYDRAFSKGNNILAYKYFQNEFAYDKEDLFNNIPMAIFSMEFINSPQSAQEIVKSINRDSISYYDCGYCRQRLDIELRAHIDLGTFDEAYKVIKLYPKPVKSVARNQLFLRSYLANQDLNAFDKEFESLRIELNEADFAHLQYLVAKDARVLGLVQLSKSLARTSLTYYKNENTSRIVDLLILLGEYKEGLQIATERWERDKSRWYNHIQMLICHAQMGNLKMAENMIPEILEKMKSDERPFGYNSYYLSYIYTVLGNHDEALQKLHQSIAEGRKFNRNRFHWDFFLLPLHEMAHFQNIIHPEI